MKFLAKIPQIVRENRKIYKTCTAHRETDTKFPLSNARFLVGYFLPQVKCWLPYWVHCGVCSSDYNIIMKLESMKEDEQFLITLSRLEELKVWLRVLRHNAPLNTLLYYFQWSEHVRWFIFFSRYWRFPMLKLRQNVGSWVHLKGSSSADLAKEYYKDVTRRQMQELHQRYQQDFELFQYDIDDFLAIAKDE